MQLLKHPGSVEVVWYPVSAAPRTVRTAASPSPTARLARETRYMYMHVDLTWPLSDNLSAWKNSQMYIAKAPKVITYYD